MKVKKEHILLILLFIFSLDLRLYFIFQNPNFNSDDAYFHLRHINYLIEEKEILYYDELSYGGREILYPPLFHILMAILTFGNIFLLKIIPAILFSLFIILIYYICREISNRKLVGLICAFMSALVPIFLIESINRISVYSLVLPILFLMFYCLNKLDKKFYLILFLVLSFLLPLIHVSSFLFILTILIYLILCWIEGIKIENIKKEAVFFSIFLIFLAEFIIYRPAFLKYGLNIIHYNIPQTLFNGIFRELSFFSLILYIGFLVLIFGFFGLYHGIARKDNPLALIFGSFIMGVLLLLVLKLIPFFVGLMFLSLGLVILSSFFILKALDSVEQTKFFKFKTLFVYVFLVIILIFSIIPAYNSLRQFSSVFDREIKDLEWISKNTEKDSVVLGLMQEGNLINAIAERKNVLDSNFLLAPDVLKRSKDVDIIYSTGFEAIALKLLDKYNVKYIYFSDEAEDIYMELKYVGDENCFKKLRERIYEVICK